MPKTYREMLAGSLIERVSLPVGQEVHTPPCLAQKEHMQARAGMSAGSGSHSNSNEMFPQWQLPEMSMAMFCARVATPNKTKLTGPPPQSLAKIDARTGGSG